LKFEKKVINFTLAYLKMCRFKLFAVHSFNDKFAHFKVLTRHEQDCHSRENEQDGTE